MLMKPKALQVNDVVATISPSSGAAGEEDLCWRYEQGVQRLVDVFQLQVKAMPNSLKGVDYLYDNPQARAADLMAAFKDAEVKAIITNIGGEDSIRLLPYIDFDVIRDHPKIVMGYSDVTILHLFCHHAGLSSFYGPAILTDFAENVAMDSYTIEMVERTLFSSEVIGEIPAAPHWTSEFLPWDESNKMKRREMQAHAGYELLQGEGIVSGRLIGGCIEVLEFAKATILWPEPAYWEESIIFFETSEEKPEPSALRYWLRNYAAQGILQKANGLIFGKPYDEVYLEEYKKEIRQVMREYGLTDKPVLYNANFGHTEPKFILPYGVMAEINCQEKTFSITENAVD